LRPRPRDVAAGLRVEVAALDGVPGTCSFEVVSAADELAYSLEVAARLDATAPADVALSAWEQVRQLAAGLDESASARAEERLAVLYLDGGYLDLALPLAERTLARARGGRDEAALATALRRVGVILERSGAYAAAAERLDEAAARARSAGDGEGEWLARFRRAIVRHQTGELERASEEFRSLREAARGLGSPRLEGLAANGLGNSLLLLGRGEAARDEFRRWLDLCRAAGDRSNEATALLCLGNVLRLLGRPDAAAARYLEAWKVVAETGAPRARGAIAASLAVCEADAGRIEVARRWLERCREYGEAMRDPHLRLAAARAELRIALADGDLPTARAAISELGDVVERVVADGLTPMQAAGVRTFFAAIPLSVQPLVRLELERAGSDEERRRAVEAGFLETGRWKARSLLLELAAHGGVVPLESVGPEEVRAELLRPGRAFVEFARGRSRLHAYVVTPDRVRFLTLAPWREIDAAAAAFQTSIGDPDALAPLDEVRRRGFALYRALLLPVLESVGEPIEELLVVPPRGLPLFPFEALATSESGPLEFVVDRLVLTGGPSAAVLVALARRPPRAAPGDVLMLVDPGDLDGLPALPGTREEAVSVVGALASAELAARVAAALDADVDVSFDVPPVVLHAGRRVTAGRFGDDATRFAWLHLAMHGVVDERVAARTGLVLADGTFGLDRVARLRLDADLVVLSACETAGGRVVRGEGARSLARSFLVAGARAVVANRWAVSDRSSAEIMRSFYAAIAAGARPAAALRAAQRAFRGDGGPGDGRRRGVGGVKPRGAGRSLPARHPFHWASFQYVGLP
ncbi:MAG: CHAT domain-containing protein, partial [Planctomycetota bacterium JB042]